MNLALRIFALGCISVVGCIPLHGEQSTGFIGKGTYEIATALLQGNVDKREDMVYSPFGYSAILAIFSEGARGVSREEIATALHFPQDVETVRQAYRSTLEKLVGKKFSNSPEFQNWFYIYKNNSVNEDLQNVLRKYYLTEIKCVDRPEDYIKETTRVPAKESPAETNKESPESAKNSMDEVKNEKEMENSVKSGEVSEENPAELAVTTREHEKVFSEASEGTKATPEKVETKSNEGGTESSPGEEKTSSEKVASESENKIMAPIKTSAELGVMPMDHFSGTTDSSLKIRGQESKSQMIIFNGLYYKGEWETPFVKKPADDSRVFYKSDTEKIFVSTIHSQGVFNSGNILNLDCKAIELPYKGGRYSLLLLVPNSRNGLTKLISDLSGYPFASIYDQLSEKLLDVCLPSFEINTISKPVKSLSKLGLSKVTTIFDPEKADLSGISDTETGLYVEELVQMVAFKVDADYSKANFLTASIASSRSNVQSFQVNQPFLFYLRDTVEDVVIVNGKVIDPTPKPSFYFS